jgi:UMF1 family MFS transporter
VEKVAIVIGTASFGVLNALTGSMRLSLLMLAVFFAAGIVVLFSFKLPEQGVYINTAATPPAGAANNHPVD